MSRRFLVLVAVVAALITRPVTAQDFYEQQFQSAKNDLAGGRLVQAVDELRIAAFGFLDRPSLLIEALVRLALAQNTLGQTEQARATVDRVVVVEQRFPVYASSALDDSTRTAFEALLLKNVARNVISSVPSFSPLVKTEVEQARALPLERRRTAFEAGFKKDPRNIQWPLEAARDAASRSVHDEVLRWTSRAFAIDNSNLDATVLAVHARAARGDCREVLTAVSRVRPADLEKRSELRADQFVCLKKTGQTKEAAELYEKLSAELKARPDVVAIEPLVKPARPTTTTSAAANAPSSTSPAPPQAAPPPLLVRTRALVRQGKFKEAVVELSSAVDADPTNRSYRLGLLEASVLAKNWRTASVQLGAITPRLTSGEEVYMFYASVALYETGRAAEARAYMERAKPRLNSSPLVDYYIKAVLGTS